MESMLSLLEHKFQVGNEVFRAHFAFCNVWSLDVFYVCGIIFYQMSRYRINFPPFFFFFFFFFVNVIFFVCMWMFGY